MSGNGKQGRILVVGIAAQWTAQILLNEFSTHGVDNPDAPSVPEDNEDREVP